MYVRRSLAAVIAVGSLLAVSSCGDSSSSTAPTATDTSTATSAPATDSTSPSLSTSPSPSTSPTGSTAKGKVEISGQNFPEATLVADMYTTLLKNAGYDPDVKLVDTRDAYLPTFPKSIDIVPEYVGGIVNGLNTQANGANAKPFNAGSGEQLAMDGKALLDKAGITLLNVSAATDTNAFFVTKKYASDNNLTKLSDLSGTSVVLASASDCLGRLDCGGGLTDQYGIKVTKDLPLGYATDQTYKSVLDGESQLGETSTTDGTLDAQGLVVLTDDKMIQPAQNLVPAVSTAFLTAHPDIAGVLNPLMAKLTTDNLTELNGEISNDRSDPQEVADAFLKAQGLD